MNSRFASIFAPLALAIPLWAFVMYAALPAAALAHSDETGATEAKALKVAEVKLAALAKEAKPEGTPVEASAPKAAEKKPSRPVRKKRLSKKSHKVTKAKLETNGKGQNIVDRRLTKAEVQGVLSTTRDFSGSDLSGMNLVGLDLSGVKFNRANLKMANLERADLAESDLELADLTGANLRGASLNQARLRGTRMEGTSMDGALWVDRTICKKGSIGSCIE